MLEKLAPTILAGCPGDREAGSSTGYLAEAAVRIMIEADILPPGALQLIMGGVGDLFDHLTLQDVVSFTGSAQTAMKLQTHPVFARESVRFIAERDSLNASILGPDAAPGTPEFDLFVKEIFREMTARRARKCTAIRRAIAPSQHIDAVQERSSAGSPRR
jgi:oxepin-CoA hydrolase/3-oxo-5,6-dehydrosuberyl-CoA semialdehyde dehydrogenase